MAPISTRAFSRMTPKQDASPQLIILVLIYTAIITIVLTYLVIENGNYILKAYNASVTSALIH